MSLDSNSRPGRFQLALNLWFLKGLICLAFFAVLVLLLLAPRRANVNDFVAYWSAGSRLIHGHDPYATGPVLLLEKQEGFTGPTPLIMRNPPWIAPIIAPLGLFTFAVAQRLWLAGGLLAILISVKWLWDLYRVSGQSGLLTSLAVAVFSPIAVALTIGQICPLILLGIAGFLRFENGGRLNLAGMFLVLVALKPHLAFLLWVAVVLGAMFNRSARILWTFTLTTAMASLVAVLFDRSIFGEYLAFVRLEGVLHELTPTPGGFLRLLFRSYIFQILPPMIAFVWFLFYAGKKFRDSVWRWKEETPMLLLVSLLTTPYAWFFDQVLLIPCIFQSLSRLSMLRERRLWQSVAFLYVAANVLVLVLIRLHRPGFYYAWTPVFWFALFMLVRLQHDRSCSGTPTTLKAAPPADGWVGADSLPD